MTGREDGPDAVEACPSWCEVDQPVPTGDGGRLVIHHGRSVGVRVGDSRAGFRVTPTTSTFYADHPGEPVPVLVDVEALDAEDGDPAASVSLLLGLDEVDQLVAALLAARAVAR